MQRFRRQTRCWRIAALLFSAVALCSVVGIACRDAKAAVNPDAKLVRGQIVDKVVCAAERNQTYALYLPSNYNSARNWPIIFAFDPGARGRVAVEAFREAAEKYGYIVMGSNNSRNGPWVASLEAIHALWGEAHTRFALDENRIFTAGFSGGARVATMMAQGVSGKIAGVIACGAGFPLGEGQGPSRETPFAYFVTVGLGDFNFRELRTLDQTLSQLGLNHRVVVFDGGHQWAPKELALLALEWMDLQTMKSGRFARDAELLEAIYAREMDEVRRLRASGDIVEAYRRQEAMASDFHGLRDTSELEAHLTKMRESKEVKQALKHEAKREANIAALETDYYATYDRVMGQLFAPGNGEYERRQAIRELRLQELQNLVAKKKDSDEGFAAQRNLYGVMVRSLEDSTQAMSRGDYFHARVELEIAAACAPDNGYVLFQLARAYALGKDSRSALDTLRKSIGHGFNDIDQIEKNPDFASLRGQSEYSEIIQTLKSRALQSPTQSP